jgi:hypothetical protein
MTEREYPRWVHGDGHRSVVVETEAEEQALLAQWAEEDAAEAAEADELPNALTTPRRGGWPKGKPRKAA